MRKRSTVKLYYENKSTKTKPKPKPPEEAPKEEPVKESEEGYINYKQFVKVKEKAFKEHGQLLEKRGIFKLLKNLKEKIGDIVKR